VGKNVGKRVKKRKIYFCFVLNKYQSVTHVSTCISVALVTNKLCAILDFFFTYWTFFPPCTLHYKSKKYFLTKNPLNYYSLKVTKFHGDSVKNKSARTKKLQEGGAERPPPSLFRVKVT